jgi:anti-anti-sigma factor
MLEVKQESRSGWCVVTVSGRAAGDTADQLETQLRSAAEQHDKVAVDFSGVDYISSAGLRAVLQAARAAQARNAEFTVCALSAPVKRVFDMSGVHHVLRIDGALPC